MKIFINNDEYFHQKTKANLAILFSICWELMKNFINSFFLLTELS